MRSGSITAVILASVFALAPGAWAEQPIPVGPDANLDGEKGDYIFRQPTPGDIFEDTAEESQTYPYVNFGMLIEVEDDHTYESGDPDAETNDFAATFEPVMAVHFLAGLSFESALAAIPFDGSFSEDEGVYFEVLSLNYGGDWFGAIGGKFTPNFGTAWDLAPGIYSVDFVEDYELEERIGFGGSLTYESDSIGSHTLSGSTFFLDTSILSDLAGNRSDRTLRSNGGPSNTGNLSSFVLGLDGGEIPDLDGLAYHVAFASQGVSQPDEKRELGYVAGVNWEGKISDGIVLAPIVESAYFENADGVDGQDRFYLTTGLGIGYDQWNLAISRTGRTTTMGGMPDIDDELVQVSAGYEFDFGLAADIGWAWIREDGFDNYLIGFEIEYEFGFCLGCGG